MYIILGGWLDGQTVKQEAGFCLFLSEIKPFSSKSFICQCKLCNGMQYENGKLYRCSNSYSKRVEACNEQCLMSCLCTLSDHLSYESDGRKWISVLRAGCHMFMYVMYGRRRNHPNMTHRWRIPLSDR